MVMYLVSMVMYCDPRYAAKTVEIRDGKKYIEVASRHGTKAIDHALRAMGGEQLEYTNTH